MAAISYFGLTARPLQVADLLPAEDQGGGLASDGRLGGTADPGCDCVRAQTSNVDMRAISNAVDVDARFGARSGVGLVARLLAPQRSPPPRVTTPAGALSSARGWLAAEKNTRMTTRQIPPGGRAEKRMIVGEADGRQRRRQRD